LSISAIGIEKSGFPFSSLKPTAFSSIVSWPLIFFANPALP